MNDVALLTDQEARSEALVTSRSYIVQAPAGSGKTELLTRRFLQLLGEVDNPEQILAITFTRAATAEMRRRILESLESAAGSNEDDATVTAARRALQHGQELGWDLLKNPQLLKIETIDSFCLALANRTPILARIGGRLQPTELADPLYRQAARRTLQQLGGADKKLSEAIAALLALRDNGLTDCEKLIAEMLASRDRWQHAYVLAPLEDWQNQVRMELEKPFRRAIRLALNRLQNMLANSGVDGMHFARLARFACANLGSPDCDKYSRHLDRIASLINYPGFPANKESDVEAWNSVANFLLTDKGTWRKRVTIAEGFPTSSDHEKTLFRGLIAQLEEVSGLCEALCDVRDLPPPHYDDEEWDMLSKLFRTLRHATAELSVIFAEQNVVDFVEIAIAASRVLEYRDDTLGDIPTEFGLAKSEQIQHLLVDEFQDTSRRQHSLLRMLAAGWTPDEGHTCFVVGDPMQSIFLFRQAEVELFQQAAVRGLGPDLPLKMLQLTTNFRSDRGVVDGLNVILTPIFGQNENPNASFVEFTPSVASDPRVLPNNVHIVANLIPPQPSGQLSRVAAEQAQAREAQQVVRIVKAHQGRIDDAVRNNRRYRVAILARARSHLLQIAHALREQGIPFRAVEMENLGERQEVLDLTALLRALLHPMDRVSWLAVLRAPWCGLTLSDLHQLCGADDRVFARVPVMELLLTRIAFLSVDGQRRAREAHAVLAEALRLRLHRSSSESLAAWLERVWHSMGGPQCVDATSYENAQIFFSMLEELDTNGTAYLGEDLDERLKRLFAQPDPAVSADCGVQLMTIHKAKGLGFEVVIVPALDRPTKTDDARLLTWFERSIPPSEAADDEEGGGSEILVAPIGAKGEDHSMLYRWVNRQERIRLVEEYKRLFYVACTRAGHELHLLGTATIKESTDSKTRARSYSLTTPVSSSLLRTAWPGLEADYQVALESWIEERAARSSAGTVIEFPEQVELNFDIAASADATLRRLPDAGLSGRPSHNVTVPDTYSAQGNSEARFQRPSGSISARAFGTAVHVLLEKAALLLTQGNTSNQAAKIISQWNAATENLLRQQGVPHLQASSLARQVISTIKDVLEDETGRWILSPHAEAQSEAAWSGRWKGNIRNVRADRVFLAGETPSDPGQSVYWIIDYKTASHGQGGLEQFLDREKAEYKAQLEAYAEVLRMLKVSSIKIRLGLFYPALRRLESWPA